MEGLRALLRDNYCLEIFIFIQNTKSRTLKLRNKYIYVHDTEITDCNDIYIYIYIYIYILLTSKK